MANDAVRKEGTTVLWAESGTRDADITLNNLLTLTGWNGALFDYRGETGGTTVRARILQANFFAELQTVGVIDEVIEFWWRESDDGILATNDDGVGSIILSDEDKLKGLRFLGSLKVDEAAANIHMHGFKEFELRTRYGGPVVFNRTADSLENVDLKSGFSTTELIDRVT